MAEYPPSLDDTPQNRSLYMRALHIYLISAYPDRYERVHEIWQWTENKAFWNGGIPREARFGCRVNPHMKLRAYKGGFYVETNDSEDSAEVRQKCKEIKKEIEDDWEDCGLTVWGRIA